MNTNDSIIAPVYGLVLTGGQSSRMKRDKGNIHYHGVSQVEYSVNLLKECCSEVFVSCRKDQEAHEHLKDFLQIHDRFIDFGSLGGILSAMSTHRNAAWLVLACDLPMIKSEVLNKLISERDAQKVATAYYHLDENRFEPLAAIYEPIAYQRMLYYLGEGKTCPQKVLFNSEIKKIDFNHDDLIGRSLVNVNTPEDYLEIKEKLL